MMSEKRYLVRLSADERSELQAFVKTGRVAAAKRNHAQVLLKADQGEFGPACSDAIIAEAVDLHTNTVKSIRQRFVEEGLNAALNRKRQKRPSRERKLDGKAEARLVALACGPPPEGRAAWTLRLLADQLVELEICDSVSHTTIWRTLKKTS